MSEMRRVSVVGNSGSGKTWVARRLAATLGVPHVELDALMHQTGWRPRPADEFLAEVERLSAQPAWVIDGNYSRVVVDGPVWPRADTVVWVDPPRWQVTQQILTRSLLRVLLRRRLWNGNRERLRNLLSLDPQRSIVAWSWTRHTVYRRRYEAAMADPRWSRLCFIHLRSRRQSQDWLSSLDLERPSSVGTLPTSGQWEQGRSSPQMGQRLEKRGQPQPETRQPMDGLPPRG
jgi:adenylate kinase family enzyme